MPTVGLECAQDKPTDNLGSRDHPKSIKDKLQKRDDRRRKRETWRDISEETAWTSLFPVKSAPWTLRAHFSMASSCCCSSSSSPAEPTLSTASALPKNWPAWRWGLSFCKVKLLGCLAECEVVLCLPFAWLDRNNHISHHMPRDKASALQRGSEKLCRAISSCVGFTQAPRQQWEPKLWCCRMSSLGFWFFFF